MPVRKFRSVEDMPPPQVLPPLDPDNLRQAIAMMDLAIKLFPIRYQPGVLRFHSVEEASRHREERERTQIRARYRERTGK